jgi:hypothetical protein
MQIDNVIKQPCKLQTNLAYNGNNLYSINTRKPLFMTYECNAYSTTKTNKTVQNLPCEFGSAWQIV